MSTIFDIPQGSAASVSPVNPSQSADQNVTTFVTLDALRTLIQDAGYRAEIVTDGDIKLLRSASNGLDFDVRPATCSRRNRTAWPISYLWCCSRFRVLFLPTC